MRVVVGVVRVLVGALSRVDPVVRLVVRVPQNKTAKNRIHLDVRVAGREVGGEERKQLVSEKVEQLVQAGATRAWKNDSDWSGSIVLRDPEGNEFCVT